MREPGAKRDARTDQIFVDSQGLKEFAKKWDSRPIPPSRFREMTREQILDVIVEHERVHRGIDWLEAIRQGDEGIRAAKRKLRACIEKSISALTEEERTQAIALGILDANGQAPVLNSFLATDAVPLPVPSSAQPFPCWFWDPEQVAAIVATQGDQIEVAIQQIVATFQVVQNDSPGGIAEEFVGFGIFGFGLRGALSFVSAIRSIITISRSTEALAVVSEVFSIGASVITLAVSVFVVAILVPILLLINKNASAVMVVVNNTQNDLVLQGLVTVHGQVLGIFESSPVIPPQQPQAILPGILVAPNANNTESVTQISAGFFTAQKMEDALIGTLGAFQFAATPDFPSGINIGWSVPLEFGSNSVLVDANPSGSLEDFASLTESTAVQTSSSTNNQTGAIVTANVNSAGGSAAYMVVNITSAPSPSGLS